MTLALEPRVKASEDNNTRHYSDERMNQLFPNRGAEVACVVYEPCNRKQ